MLILNIYGFKNKIVAWNKHVVYKFYLPVCCFHVRVQSSTCTTYGIYLWESTTTILTQKLGMKNLHYRTKFNGKFMKTIYSVFGDCDSILRSIFLLFRINVIQEIVT